jgi:sugar porter (SP) family MFS transporter
MKEEIQDNNDGQLEVAHIDHVDLNNNLTGKIQNPLAGLSEATLLRDVAEFARVHDLQDIEPELRKGALVASDPDNFENVHLLDENDKLALRNEVDHKWSHPWRLYVTIIVCSVGAAVQGWDQTGSNGANLSFPAEFGIGSGSSDALPHPPNWARDNWLVGLVNSGPYLGSAFLGCWIADPLNFYFGRRTTIFISGIFVFITPIASGFAQTWVQLFIIRFIMGIGMGLKGSTVPVFAAENSPAMIRGALVMSWQLWTAFGIWLGTCANLAVKDVETISWRLQLGSAFIPAVPLLVGIYFCPESPRWYIKKNRLRKAYNSLVRLRHTKLQAARDLYYIYAQIQVEKAVMGKSNYFTRFSQLFTIPRVRRATLASFVVMLSQQLCGINIIAFYSSTIFANAGASTTGALFASFGFGLVNFVFAFPAIWTIDTFGRRSLLLFTFPNMAWTLLAAGMCFFIDYDANPATTAHLGTVALFIYLFAAFYSPGEGPVPFAYSAEVFPLSHREVGMGWAVATCLFWAAVLSMALPSILYTFTAPGMFGFFTGLNVLAFFLIFLFVPETKQRTLEELDYIFAVPTRTFIHYNITKAVPYWWNHGILRRNVPEPYLYHFDRPEHKKEKTASQEAVAIENNGVPVTGDAGVLGEQEKRAL